ncbi:DUF4232 domain-containing protein [Streptomyces sp. NPDC047072]|uniref:DUF4232 domain-containing protein n=1 Tax=Streptomyces sp. NPDC047072 TaxID=3154809 RepID=UPI0033E1959A
MLHTRKAAAAVIGLVAALSLTACNGDDNASDSAQAAPTEATATPGSAGASEQAGQSAGASAGTSTGDTGSGKAGICRTDELEVDASDNTTDKTEGVVTVSFKNGGGRDCRIYGFAGVDLKTAQGDTLSVTRNSEKPLSEILADGDSAAFNITFPYNNSGGSGVQLTDLVVTPPNETKSVTLKWPAGSLPVSDGSDSVKLEISPVGKVG